MSVTKNAVMSVCAITVLAGTSATTQAELIYGLTNTNTLVSWDSGDSTDILSGVAVSGLMANEQLRGIDFRPATGQLYGVGSFNNLYTIDVGTGQATQVGSGPFAPGGNGSSFGFDFNPVIDRIRYVSDANQNLVLNPNDGTATQATDLFFGAGDVNQGMDPSIVGSAYTNSFFGAMSTQLYGIDSELNILVTQANSAGTLMTIGSLGIDVNDTLSFDISGTSGIAFATFQLSDMSRSSFWMIDLNSGNATQLGEIGGGAVITSMAVLPTPASVALLGMGGLFAGRRRRS